MKPLHIMPPPDLIAPPLAPLPTPPAPWADDEPRLVILLDTDRAIASMIACERYARGKRYAAYLERDQFGAFGWFEAHGKAAPIEAFGAELETEPFNGGVRFRAAITRARPVATTGGRLVYFESENHWSALHERFHGELLQ